MEETIKEKYVFYEELGSGGSGRVFKAYDRHLKSFVAIKRFRAEDGISGRELEMLKELRHSAFPVVTDYMEESGYQYLVMEYIEGRNLADYIEEEGAIEQERAVTWALELAEVLIYLHERKCPVIYQDMKPANIMIDRKGNLRLVDFGTAFLRYQEGQEVCAGGTWGYAPPEQFEMEGGRVVDERSDIYGLGATLFHMLTGCNPSLPPFLMQSIRFYDRKLSVELEKIVRRATEQEKEKRYPTVRQLKQELENYRRADRRKEYAVKTIKMVYGMAVAGFMFSFMWLWAWLEKVESGGYEVSMGEKRAMEGNAWLIAGCVLLLCIGKSVAERWMSRGYRSVRQEKSMLLTMKKGKGLAMMTLLLGMLAAGMAGSGRVWAKEDNILFVIVRNEKGQKILIRYDAEYLLSDTLKLELPLKNFKEGERYELRLECTNRETGEMQSRTFYLKGLEP